MRPKIGHAARRCQRRARRRGAAVAHRSPDGSVLGVEGHRLVVADFGGDDVVAVGPLVLQGLRQGVVALDGLAQLGDLVLVALDRVVQALRVVAGRRAGGLDHAHLVRGDVAEAAHALDVHGVDGGDDLALRRLAAGHGLLVGLILGLIAGCGRPLGVGLLVGVGGRGVVGLVGGGQVLGRGRVGVDALLGRGVARLVGVGQDGAGGEAGDDGGGGQKHGASHGEHLLSVDVPMNGGAGPADRRRLVVISGQMALSARFGRLRQPFLATTISPCRSQSGEARSTKASAWLSAVGKVSWSSPGKAWARMRVAVPPGS